MSASITLAAASVACGAGVEGAAPLDAPDSGEATSSGGNGSSSDSSSNNSSGGTTLDDGGAPADAGNLCGNGSIDQGETCDDGNTSAGDGCSATCAVEPGFECPGAGACAPVCGNGLVQTREACDPGPGDAGAGCSSTCSIELGFSCTAPDGGAAPCAAVCGDGLVAGNETCDEGPYNGEPGHCNGTCSGVAAPICGDGRIQDGEGCDDGASNGTSGACPADCSVPTPTLPSPSSTYSGNVRGYFFTAPKDFVITSLYVPKDASTGKQSIAVLRLPAAPPAYSGTTNTFDTLFLVQASAQDTSFDVKLPVSKDDVIVVLGNRGDVNSYSSGSYTTQIDGTDVLLQRTGMQYALSTTAPKEIWSEVGNPISRVQMATARSQCGDGVRVDSEECDDGNLVNGDGCSATCTVESGFACSEGPIGITQSVCTSTCGDGTVASTEACDDGAQNGTAGKCAADCSGFTLDVGAHASASTAGTHGFWFTAPAGFVLTGLRAPSAAGAGNQAVQVVKLLEAPPASGVTNAFQTLAYTRDVAGDAVTRIRVPVAAGDRIGILGGRGVGAAITSSLSSGAVTSSVKNTSVQLLPLAIDGSIDSAPASNLRASSTAGAIGRVDVLWGN